MSAIYTLLTQASSLSCSNGAAAFLSLIPSENNWFPFALGSLLPTLQDQDIQTPQRILAAYVLHALYAAHHNLNPFYDHLVRIFESEKIAAVAHSQSLELRGSPQYGGNDQLVWVLWKILRGEGEDLAPYSPSTLSRTALPEHFHALHLELPTSSPDINIHGSYSPNDTIPPFVPQLKMTTASDISLKQDLSPSVHIHSHTFTPQPPAPTPSVRTASTTSFSPFDNDSADPRSTRYQNTQGRVDNEWVQERLNGFHGGLSADFSRIAYPHSQSTYSESERAHESPLPIDQPIPATMDNRRQTLLRALYQDPAQYELEDPSYPRDLGAGGREWEQGRPIDGEGYVSSWARQETQTHRSQRLPSSQPALPHLQTQFPALPLDGIGALNPFHDPTPAGSSLATSTTAHSPVRPRPEPIARPRPAPTLSYTSPSHAYALAAPTLAVVDRQTQPVETVSQKIPSPIANGLLRDPRASLGHGVLPQIHPPSANGHSQQIPNHAPSENDLPRPVRTPGVIGSGRPSRKISPVMDGGFSSKGSSPGASRPHVGVIGNGRPVRDLSPGGVELGVTDGSRATVPRSVRTERSMEDSGKRDFGAIGRPRDGGKDSRGGSVGPGLGRGDGGVRKEEASLVNPFAQDTLLVKMNEMALGSSKARAAQPTSLPSPNDSTVTTPPSVIVHPQATHAPKAPPDTANTPSPGISPLETNLKSESNPSQHASTSTSPAASVGPPQPVQTPQSPHLPLHAASQEAEFEPGIDEKERDELSRAIVLLLSARERVLTLSEQRTLIPHLPMLTRPLSLLRPGDLPPLVAKNPDVAAKLLVLVLDRDDEDSARVGRVLRDVSQNALFHPDSALGPEQAAAHSLNTVLNSVDAASVIESAIEFVNNYGRVATNYSGSDKVSPFGGREAGEGYLDALRKLPPTMQSFNLIAKLLRPAPAISVTADEEDTAETRVARLVSAEVLGGLVSGCVQWIEKAEQEEREGGVLDDRVAISVSSLSRFYASLLKHGFVSAASEVDTTEIMSFALQFSRFEEARSLYSTLAAARV